VATKVFWEIVSVDQHGRSHNPASQGPQSTPGEKWRPSVSRSPAFTRPQSKPGGIGAANQWWALENELIKLTTALRLGTADAESILRRFTKHNSQHPTYKALCELGKALKTTFLCDYLRLESLRREIQDGLQVILRDARRHNGARRKACDGQRDEGKNVYRKLFNHSASWRRSLCSIRLSL
jgi:hypothetical protein